VLASDRFSTVPVLLADWQLGRKVGDDRAGDFGVAARGQGNHGGNLGCGLCACTLPDEMGS
jgi:hypothetical protein